MEIWAQPTRATNCRRTRTTAVRQPRLHQYLCGCLFEGHRFIWFFNAKQSPDDHAPYPRAVEKRGQLLQGVREEELEAMDKQDAVAFFRAQGIRGTHAEIEAACEPYGYHPLSLRILSGWILNNRSTPGDIAAARNLELTKDIIQNKHHILEVGFDSLSPSQKKLLGRIACFRAAMTYEALKTLHGDGRGNLAFDKSLKALESRGLLHWDRKTNKYDLHPIVRRFAYDRLTVADRSGAHERLVNYFEAVPKLEKVQNSGKPAPCDRALPSHGQGGKLDEARNLYATVWQTQFIFSLEPIKLKLNCCLHCLLMAKIDLPR